jgi:hypothetical protein
MTKDDTIKLAREAGMFVHKEVQPEILAFANLVAAAERDALEAELLKLKKGISASNMPHVALGMYIQGRWDLIGEFQDIIKARGNT